MFNSVFRTALQMYLPLCISCFVSLKYAEEAKQSVSGYILLTVFLVSPFLVVCILRKQKFPLGHPKLKASIGTLY